MVATAMAGGTDNNQLKLAAKTQWRWQHQFVEDDKDDNHNDDNEHDKHDNDDNKDDKQDDEDDKHNEHNNEDNNHDDEADTATAVGGDDNGGNSNGWGHRQQSTKIGSKDTVVVATAIC
jgi:hypothetical protein